MDNLKYSLLEEIIIDEREYCFDRNYCDDVTWLTNNGSETREEAFERSINHWRSASIEEIQYFFGDKYSYVFERLNS